MLPIVLFITLLLSILFYGWAYLRFFRVLERAHRDVWLGLHIPCNIVDPWRSPEKEASGRRFGYLLVGHYRSLGDPRLDRAGAIARIAFVLMVAIGVLVFLTVALRGRLHLTDF